MSDKSKQAMFVTMDDAMALPASVMITRSRPVDESRTWTVTPWLRSSSNGMGAVYLVVRVVNGDWDWIQGCNAPPMATMIGESRREVRRDEQDKRVWME